MQPRPGARSLAASFVVRYELSRALHRAAIRRAERFGPIRISALQCGHCQVELLAVPVGQGSGGSGAVDAATGTPAAVVAGAGITADAYFVSSW